MRDLLHTGPGRRCAATPRPPAARRDRGAALLTVAVTLLVVGVLGAAMARLYAASSRELLVAGFTNEAFCLAESGARCLVARVTGAFRGSPAEFMETLGQCTTTEVSRGGFVERTVTLDDPVVFSLSDPGRQIRVGVTYSETYDPAAELTEGAMILDAVGQVNPGTSLATAVRNVYRLEFRSGIDWGVWAGAEGLFLNHPAVVIDATGAWVLSAGDVTAPKGTIRGSVMAAGSIIGGNVARGETDLRIEHADVDLPPLIPAPPVTGAVTFDPDRQSPTGGTYYTNAGQSGIQVKGEKWLTSTSVVWLIDGSISFKNVTWAIASDVTLVVRGDLELLSNADFSVTAGGRLTVYASGSITLHSNPEVDVARGGSARNVRFIGTSATPGATTVTVDASSSFVGLIYAPNSNVSLENNIPVRGAVCGRRVSLSNSVNLTYDPTLRNMGLPGLPACVTVAASGRLRSLAVTP